MFCDKNKTVVGSCGHIRVIMDAWPFEGDKDAKQRCAKILKRKVADAEAGVAPLVKDYRC